jgi:hypothetical protein
VAAALGAQERPQTFEGRHRAEEVQRQHRFRRPAAGIGDDRTMPMETPIAATTEHERVKTVRRYPSTYCDLD